MQVITTPTNTPNFDLYINFHFLLVNMQSKANAAYLIYPAVQSKGKAIPLQAWTGPEGSRRLRFPDFKTIDT